MPCQDKCVKRQRAPRAAHHPFSRLLYLSQNYMYKVESLKPYLQNNTLVPKMAPQVWDKAEYIWTEVNNFRPRIGVNVDIIIITF